MKNIVKTIWNSKAFETFAEANYNVLKSTKSVAECILDVANELFSSNDNGCSYYHHNNNPEKSVEEQTYEYWNNLTCVDQESYFKRNYKLQEYGDAYFYSNKEQCARSVAEIARRENRTFCDKYDRY